MRDTPPSTRERRPTYIVPICENKYLYYYNSRSCSCSCSIYILLLITKHNNPKTPKPLWLSVCGVNQCVRPACACSEPPCLCYFPLSFIHSFLPFSALPILLLHSYGVSIAYIKLLLILDFPLYSQAPSNISMLIAIKMDKMSSECSRQATRLSSGFSTTLEPIQAHHNVLQEAHLMVKKSLLPSIQSS